MRKLFVAIAALVLLCLCVAAQAVVMETVAVGDAGNAADMRLQSDGTSGYGSVGYDYRIGKYEVTAGQYTEFLNAKAATDTYGLYDTAMANDAYEYLHYECKIQRSGSSGSYTYSVASEYANRPVNYVSWYDTLRFANWLTNGQGGGSTESGSYLITGGGLDSGTVTIPTAAQRKTWSEGATAKWLLTSEDEWYKAAYYKNGVYSEYANGTNAAPSAGTASNYDFAVDHTWDGSVNGALEQNGTKDMVGNVWEWNEAPIDALRGLRGGSFDSELNTGWLQASFRDITYPAGQSYFCIGFRVSQVAPVPEPSSIIALAGGLVGLLGLRRRRP